MKKILFAAAVVLAGSLSCQAQVTTDPVGFVSVTVPAASDAAVGVPLGLASEFQGVIQSISGNTITMAGTPGWTASQFLYVAPVGSAASTQPKTYYIRIDSGVREGLIATITANDASSVTITVPNGDDLTGVLTNAANGTGDSISIAPYWTLATLITGVPAGTKVLLYPTNTTTTIPGYPANQSGINIAGTAYTYTGTNWKNGSFTGDDTILPAYQGFTVRNNSAAAITISITGSVPMSTSRMVLRTLSSNTSQDQRIFFNSPVPELLSSTNLGLTPGDSVLTIDNTATGQNKAGNKITWTGTQWRQGNNDVTSTYMLQPGTSYILRKISTATPGNSISTHLQSYLQ